MDFLICLMFLSLVLTTFLIFKVIDKNDQLYKNQSNLITITTYVNMFITFIFIRNLSVNNDLGRIINSIGNYIAYNSIYKGLFISIVFLCSLILLSVLFNVNLKNIALNKKNNKIILSSKIYTAFLYILSFYTLNSLFTNISEYQIKYQANFLNMSSESIFIDLIVSYSGLMFILLVFNVLNIINFIHFSNKQINIQNKIENLSQEDLIKINKFNFGAFFLTWYWGIFNESYKLIIWYFIISLIPFLGNFVNLVMPFIFGIKGNKLAYEHQYYKNIEDFNKSQRLYTTIGCIFFVIILVFLILLLIFIPIILKANELYAP